VPAYTLGFKPQLPACSDLGRLQQHPARFESSLGYFRRKDIQAFSARPAMLFLPQND